MALDQLDSFMHSISALESGHNYDARGPDTGTYGRALGRYQIMSKIYPTWAREAGVDPNDLSPAAQDRVARHKMTQYYNKYGSWDLVAIAWFAGPGAANTAQRKGISSVAGREDMLGTNVASYVKKAVGGMGEGSIADSGGGGATATMAPPVEMEAQMAPDEADQMTQDMMGEILSTISEAAKGNGFGQVLDLKAMFGMPKVAPPPEAEEPLLEGITEPEAIIAKSAPSPASPRQADGPTRGPENPRQADGPMAAPPKHSGFEGLKAPAQTGTQRLMGQFPGLRFTSGYRDPKRNAAAGGVKNSKHLTGMASDFVGSEEEMQAAAAWAKSQGARVLIHDSGSGRHLHIEWG